jgi:hypothetical protein
MVCHVALLIRDRSGTGSPSAQTAAREQTPIPLLHLNHFIESAQFSLRRDCENAEFSPAFLNRPPNPARSSVPRKQAQSRFKPAFAFDLVRIGPLSLPCAMGKCRCHPA